MQATDNLLLISPEPHFPATPPAQETSPRRQCKRTLTPWLGREPRCPSSVPHLSRLPCPLALRRSSQRGTLTSPRSPPRSWVQFSIAGDRCPVPFLAQLVLARRRVSPGAEWLLGTNGCRCVDVQALLAVGENMRMFR